MRILVDENIPLITVKTLDILRYDVKDIRGTPKEGLPDDDLWEMARQEKRLLITTDTASVGVATNLIMVF